MLMVTVNMSDSSSDSKDEDSGPSKEDCITKFKEMLKERGVAPFSKWEKELPKNVFDPRFKAIPSQSVGRALFEPMLRHVLRRKDIDYNTDYQTFRKKWGSDPRFEALDHLRPPFSFFCLEKGLRAEYLLLGTDLFTRQELLFQN
ncbi:pre-mRNA-processing protein 40C-like isoform X1 [Pistacia vera]|uniref:pre-mRNA-processing protein 40C-like isoform X1 n=1 Tax=Pistacia vera TaxID=55513 RepID=UPI001262EAC4|nr:pre-mRNA-processing protein 40C-like isoform X1 [Pistacia vera]XP_031266410.1 pre-mRNA-processing protein 40C-like isoform X1 [Pistacia vera]XP_031266411.1 pre-mRNA-processing protein 40C-like isoform X1 [Pistacia vera]